ncbi:carbonic anhydrase family protein [Pseudomonas putida]|nr:carbonic anhydrase family protein [Pseudomonas putida]UTL78922.1 carbonic anhydrase family protein [Pseudomonas putida]
MKITGLVEVEAVTDVTCDVCGYFTRGAGGGYQYGAPHAHWGCGSEHDGQRFEVHLCEHCFFQTLAYLKQERRVQQLFSDEPSAVTDDLGLVAQDDCFQDMGRR